MSERQRDTGKICTKGTLEGVSWMGQRRRGVVVCVVWFSHSHTTHSSSPLPFSLSLSLSLTHTLLSPTPSLQLDLPLSPSPLSRSVQSARCLHGRMASLKGASYSNIFSHYRPVGDPAWLVWVPLFV